MNSPYAKELSVAIGALQKAAQLSQSIVSEKDKGAIEKDDLSPVTVADFAVQALLTATIKNAFPEDKVVGEEDASDLRQNSVLMERVWQLLEGVAGDGDTVSLCKLPESREQMCDLIDECGASSPSATGRTWVFDPIDGTKTYLLGQLYAINTALLVDGEQIVGIVGAPNLSIDAKAPLKNEDIDPKGEGCIFFAVKGHGAYIRPLKTDQPRRLPLYTNNDISLVTSSTVNSALFRVHENVASRLNTAYPGNDLLPWVLRWAVLAMGLGNTTVWVYRRPDRYAKVWDHAGAMLLFEETGGKITDVWGRKINLAAGRMMSANFGFVGAREEHERVLQVVKEAYSEQIKLRTNMHA
ncbi:3 (2) 5 bisphosphate nucleotidase [Fusarium subglutinans]|uniref:3 (2) 5 bisphosphate nucleotidase n=1 Tax=Gibberella subglutinans TaxID=42677 RepID=A0A8H5QAY3_GIBSU|nr:3 (2) 5 bisphosphate nucleotidase [Fusarium subglutinans]KAF5611889.1 3 (2) 5 bisphosphate nucleotidase [Fusarium subglutinans]